MKSTVIFGESEVDLAHHLYKELKSDETPIDNIVSIDLFVGKFPQLEDTVKSLGYSIESTIGLDTKRYEDSYGVLYISRPDCVPNYLYNLLQRFNRTYILVKGFTARYAVNEFSDVVYKLSKYEPNIVEQFGKIIYIRDKVSVFNSLVHACKETSCGTKLLEENRLRYKCIADCPEREGETKCMLSPKQYENDYKTRTEDWCPCGNAENFVLMSAEEIKTIGEE